MSAAMRKEIFDAGMVGYGFGWFVGKAFDQPRHRHTGNLPGYLADFVRFPDARMTLIVLSNHDRSAVTRMVRDVSAIILGKPFDMPVQRKAASLTSTQVEALIGEYSMQDGTNLRRRKSRRTQSNVERAIHIDSHPLVSNRVLFGTGRWARNVCPMPPAKPAASTFVTAARTISRPAKIESARLETVAARSTGADESGREQCPAAFQMPLASEPHAGGEVGGDNRLGGVRGLGVSGQCASKNGV